MKKERYNLLKEDENTSKRIVFLQKGKKRKQFKIALKKIQIVIREGTRFQNWIDTGLDIICLHCMIDNLPPNYEMILTSSIDELISKNKFSGGNIGESNVECLQNILLYIERIISEIKNKIERVRIKNADEASEVERLSKSLRYFIRMKSNKAETAEEALQRILFWSSLFWQTKHRLVGIGRLDKLLNQYDVINEEDGVSLLIDFYEEMHKYYAYKSNTVSLGDTGQIIIIGGRNEAGGYFCNKWTYLIIQALIKHKLPDPKLLLRVSANMPDTLLELAVECIATGVGYPLLANDEVIIPALEKFGYTHRDACDYVTSACWEPLAYGKSLEKNNMRDLNFAQAVVDMYTDERFEHLQSFDEVKALYIEKLGLIFLNILRELDAVEWENDPLMSLFTDGCLETGKDVSDGGARYSDYGILTVGLANAIDSLLNVQTYVFKNNIFSLKEIKNICQSNYFDEKAKNRLSEEKYFSMDIPEVFWLIKDIMGYIDALGMQYRNKFGGKLKWGYSSSNYMELGKVTDATIDGRKSGEPLAVHISPAKGCGYTELINFAGQLDYEGNHANGNVVDFFLSPSFIKKNKGKFVRFLKIALERGFFQMQINVVDSQTLIEAKRDPEKFPDLIVRVWGFSAYFKDLPESYKELLIRRAMESERIV